MVEKVRSRFKVPTCKTENRGEFLRRTFGVFWTTFRTCPQQSLKILCSFNFVRWHLWCIWIIRRTPTFDEGNGKVSLSICTSLLSIWENSFTFLYFLVCDKLWSSYKSLKNWEEFGQSRWFLKLGDERDELVSSYKSIRENFP